jgi:hypothetical protein
MVCGGETGEGIYPTRSGLLLYCPKGGCMASSRIHQDVFIEVLTKEIQEERQDLIPISVVDVSDQGLSCYWRRTSTSIALARGVDEKDIDFMNRWHTAQNAKAGKARCL